ncbi:MAG TPA: TraX family protein [Clostridia bacterium]|nr:TraX family protein [Clostridia bacterium]
MTSGDADTLSAEKGQFTLEQSDALKLIAIICMTVDHVGAILLPQAGWLRIIGRVAFPLFACQLAVGYMHTHNLPRYVLRLAIWGLIAQPIYMIAFDVRPWTFNIFGTLLLGLLAIWGWDQHRWWAVVFALSLAAVQLWLRAVGPDYGVYGVLLCLVSFVLSRDRRQLAVGHALLHWLAGIMFWPSQVYAVVSIPLILWPPRLHLGRLSRLFYAYYPAHLALLVLIRLLLAR